MRRLKSEAEAMNPHVTIDPEIMGGVPVVSGTRIPVHSLLGRIEEGESVADIEKDLKRVSREAIEAAIAYARANPREDRPRQYR